MLRKVEKMQNWGLQNPGADCNRTNPANIKDQAGILSEHPLISDRVTYHSIRSNLP